MMSFEESILHERIDKLELTNGELCAEINRQERRIRELEAYKDALARDLEAAEEQLSVLVCHVDALKLYASKAKEAVQALYVCSTDGDCDDCPVNGAPPWGGDTVLCSSIAQWLDELGIEVRR